MKPIVLLVVFASISQLVGCGGASATRRNVIQMFDETGAIDPAFHGGLPLTRPVLGGSTWSGQGHRALAIDGQNLIVACSYDSPSAIVEVFHASGRPFRRFGGLVSAGFAAGLFPRAVAVVRGRDGALSTGFVVVGRTEDAGGARAIGVARFTLDGPDRSFGLDGRVITRHPTCYANEPAAATFDRRGRLLVAGGCAGGPDSEFPSLIVRYQPDGRLDPTFGSGGFVFGPRQYRNFAICVDTAERILVAGIDISGRGTHVSRFSTDGRIDTGFGSGGSVVLEDTIDPGTFASIALDSRGRIVVLSSRQHPRPAHAIAIRLLESGELDRTFGSGGRSVLSGPRGLQLSAWNLQIDSVDRIVFAGRLIDAYATIRGSSLVVGRLDSSGRLDRSFSDNGLAVSSVRDSSGRSVAMGGSRIVAGGVALID